MEEAMADYRSESPRVMILTSLGLQYHEDSCEFWKAQCSLEELISEVSTEVAVGLNQRGEESIAT